MRISHRGIPGRRLVLAVFFVSAVQAAAQVYPDKIGGFIGPYHPFDGHVYAGENVPESTALHDAFNFGTYGRITHGEYGYNFPLFIHNSCEVWNINLMYGICRPPSESGVINNPADTSIYNPTAWPPGMIQGAHRFSELAKIYPQVDGMIIDDFYHNYPGSLSAAQLLDIRDALRGKTVDSSGAVHHETTATTPHLKLYICMYEREMSQNPDSILLNRIDGVNFWIWYQNSYYSNFLSYINSVASKFPGKDIIPGDYLYNGTTMTPASIDYIFERAIDLYDDGKVRGLLMFAGHWFCIENISRTRWNDMALPREFNQMYYPYLGRGAGRVVEESTGLPIRNAWITGYASGRVSGDTFYVTRQRSDSAGCFAFGAWAGNRTTDSTRYWLVAEKENYRSDTVWGWIGRQRTAQFPDLILRAPVGAPEDRRRPPGAARLACAPDPGRGEIRIEYATAGEVAASLRIFDALGREIAVLEGPRVLPAGTRRTVWNGRDRAGRPLPAGVYFCRLESGPASLNRKITLVR